MKVIKENIYEVKSKKKKKKNNNSLLPHGSDGFTDVEYDIKMFNHMNNVDQDTSINSDSNISPDGIAESTASKDKYMYKGPVYRFERLYTILNKPIYTYARSEKEAINNINGKLKKRYGFAYSAKLNIDETMLQKIEKDVEYKTTKDTFITTDDHDAKDLIFSYKGFDIYFEDGYYIIEGMNTRFISESDVMEYIDGI